MAFLLMFAAGCSLFASCTEELSDYQDPNPADAAKPVLVSIEPNTAAVSDTVTITGTGFNINPVYDFVSFQWGSGTVIAATDTTLQVIVPSSDSLTVKVKATVKGSVYWSNTLDFTYIVEDSGEEGGE